MSYTHLAGRLIEVQRSMLGQPAVTVARSIDGLSVTPDGNVDSIDRSGPAVVEQLFDRYTDMLGDPAERRLQTAAEEFADELDLPPKLRPEGEVAHDEQSFDSEPHIEDATSIEVESPGTDADDSAQTEPTNTVELPAQGTTIRREYTVQATTAPSDDTDLADVYLLREQDGWQVPISVEEAITEAITGKTELSERQRRHIDEQMQATEILSVLGSESETAVSFDIGPVVVAIHPSGTIAARRKQ